MTTCRLMIVDDDAIMREVLRELIEGVAPEFKVVAEASNGQEAVYRAERVEPDVIVMDVRMPVMDGIEATRRIKQDLAIKTVIVTATSFTQPAIKEAAFEAGASFYLQKPFNHDEIYDVLIKATGEYAMIAAVSA